VIREGRLSALGRIETRRQISCGYSSQNSCLTCLQMRSRCPSRSLWVSRLAGHHGVICTPGQEGIKIFNWVGLSPELPLRRFPDPPPPSREMSALNALASVSRADLFRDGIGLLCWVPVDEVIVPISVDTNTSLRDHQGSRRDVDECAARAEAGSKLISSVAHWSKRDHRPNDEHVPTQTLADFAYKEIRVGESHASTDDRDRDALVSPRDRHESPLRGKFERYGVFVQVLYDDKSPGWGSHCHLKPVDTKTRRWQRKDSNIRFCWRLRPP